MTKILGYESVENLKPGEVIVSHQGYVHDRQAMEGEAFGACSHYETADNTEILIFAHQFSKCCISINGVDHEVHYFAMCRTCTKMHLNGRHYRDIITNFGVLSAETARDINEGISK